MRNLHQKEECIWRNLDERTCILLIVIGTVIGVIADTIAIIYAIISAVKWIIKKATATDQG